MSSIFFRSIILTAIILAGSLLHFGQVASETPAAPGNIFDGEKLTFDGKVSKLKVNISIADLILFASRKPASNELVITTEAVSKGTMLKLFRFSFLQKYESTIDITSFRIVKTTKHDVQKQRVRDSEANFDYAEKRVSYMETDPKDMNRPPRRIASEIGEMMSDMVSAIYYVRLQKLAVGSKFDLEVSDSGLVFKVPVIVAAREQQKTVLGNVWCFRVEPEIFGKNRLIEQKGKMIIWMTDDERHTPVLAKVDTQYGKVEVKLKSVFTGR